MSLKFTINFLIIVLLFTSGCKFRKIQKSADWKEKYEAAVNYYNEKDYYHANILFDEIIPLIRGTEEAELANYYHAYTFFYQKQYLLSSHHFKNFSDVYARSEYAKEARYMAAYSLYLQSPEATLDQTSTYEALTSMQDFINKFPYTELSIKADSLIDIMRVKLETKAYMNVKLYFNLRKSKYGGYQAALTTADNFHDSYPDSKYNEEVLFLEVSAAYEYASQSIPSKQKERYEVTVSKYESLVDKYPNSKYIKMTEDFYKESTEQLATFANQNQVDNTSN